MLHHTDEAQIGQNICLWLALVGSPFFQILHVYVRGMVCYHNLETKTSDVYSSNHNNKITHALLGLLGVSKQLLHQHPNHLLQHTYRRICYFKTIDQQNLISTTMYCHTIVAGKFLRTIICSGCYCSADTIGHACTHKYRWCF